MDRVRVGVKDKRALALVKAFLKAGILTEAGDREDTYTGTPQGGILSPVDLFGPTGVRVGDHANVERPGVGELPERDYGNASVTGAPAGRSSDAGPASLACAR